MSLQTLHIVNNENRLLDLVIAKGDGLLFIENGVYFARSLDLQHFEASVKIYVLEADLMARGFDTIDHCVSISYEGFVDLCSESVKVVSW